MPSSTPFPSLRCLRFPVSTLSKHVWMSLWRRYSFPSSQRSKMPDWTSDTCRLTLAIILCHNSCSQVQYTASLPLILPPSLTRPLFHSLTQSLSCSIWLAWPSNIPRHMLRLVPSRWICVAWQDWERSRDLQGTWAHLTSPHLTSPLLLFYPFNLLKCCSP